MPNHPRQTPQHRWHRYGLSRLPTVPVLTVTVVAVAWCLPLLLSSASQLQILMVVFLNASLAVGLAISLGYAGLLNLSHGTFYGLGAYATAILVTAEGWPFELAALTAVLVGALGAVLLGLASSRVRGDFFALVSLAFTIAVVEVIQHWTALTRGREGFFGIPEQSVLGLRVDSFKSGYFVALGLLTLTMLASWRIVSTFAGRAMLAVRHDEVAAAAMGIHVLYTRLLSMAVSGGLAGLAGSVLVATVLFISPSDFDLNSSFSIALWVVIGGMASLPGAAAAGAGVALVTAYGRQLSDYSVGLVGLIVLVAVMVRGGVLRDLWRGLRVAGLGRERR